MADQRVAPGATGYVRLLGVLALLLGIAAMHAGVFSAGHDMPAASGPSVVVAESMAASGHAPGPQGDHSGGHTSSHGCDYLILTGLLLGIGLVLLGWITDRSRDVRPPALATWRIHRERPPPWTSLSLSELSILRI
ncbi:DUF6153 family protein [Nocardia sp. NPDC005825]|uniref:DUF6153 family protein n=1 Tax=unclassified Nocardia TaxID=2637762 RepID=UPI0033C03C4D